MHFKERFKQVRSVLLGIDPGVMTLYYKYFYQPKEGTIAAIIDQKAKEKKAFYFLQIGGNDGFVSDPIFRFVKRYSWKGIIVEPQKGVFNKRLKKTYRWESKVILENVAISAKKEIRKLYKLTFSESRWATGLATFDRQTLEAQIDRNYVDERARKEGVATPDRREDYITFEEVPCETIEGLLEKHQFDSLDLLQIDTEGYDFEIIKTINFAQLKPTMISFENEHLGKEDQKKCETLLIQNGYTVEHIGRDSIAYL